MVAKKLVFIPAWCKGCGICIALCPRQALGMDNGKAVPSEGDLCVACGQCEQWCPDYAIYLEDTEEVRANG